MSKVKAFTILEMLINLTIMSIIMGLIYFAYSAFVQQVINYQTAIDQENSLNQIYVQLKTDFFESEKVVKSGRDIKIISYKGEEVSYKQTDQFLIRKQAQVLDTLPVTQIKTISKTNKITREELVTKLIVETTLFNEPVAFSILKEYAPNLKLQF